MPTNKKITIQLKGLAEIRVGPYLQPDANGKIAYLQARNFDDRGQLSGEPDTFVVSVPGNRLLVEGDVLFTGKGVRQFAWAYDPAIGPAVASSLFFVIHPDPGLLLGAYLAAWFNTPAMRAHFAQIGAGTNIPSIRKSELEALEIPLPSLQRQKQVAGIYELHERAVRLQHRIAEIEDQYFQTLLQQLTQAG